jgi:small subunit ribosomal protein S20
MEVRVLANTKSAKKRIKVTARRTLRNKIIRSQTKTAIKKLLVCVSAGDKTAAREEFRKTMKAIDKACTKGIIHKNNASRKKSRLAVRINKMP